ncbi:MAG: hypothetical protein GY953_27220, partial [bacterium]|nr:hypothetical protein [bacterium]
MLDSFAIDAVTPSLKLENIAWNGVVSGPIQGSGGTGEKLHDVVVSSTLTVIPAPGEHPLEGEVAVEFQQSVGALTFGPSNLATRSSRLEFSGSIENGIEVSLETENLDDFLPALAMAIEDPPEALPAKLTSGIARVTGTVSGAWNAPRIRGRLTTGAVEYEGHTVDRLTADFEANDSRLRANNISAFQGLARLRGEADVVLEQWSFTENSGINGQLSLTGADLRQLLTKAGQDLDMDGTLSAAAKLEGTAVNPSVLASLHVDSPVAYEEEFDRLDAEVRYATGLLEVNAGRLDRGRGLLTFSAAYKHPAESWDSGELRFESG